MAQRRTRKGNQSADDAKEMRQKKLDIFIQQFEKEANSRIMEMERKMEDMLATVDRVFKVELLKMPPSLQITRLADLTSAEEVSAGDITIAMQTACPEFNQPLTKMSSKRVKQSDGPNQIVKTQKKTKKGGEGAKITRTLGYSNSTGSLRTTAKRTGGRQLKSSDQSMPEIPKSRSNLLSSASSDDRSCSAMGSNPHITLTTSDGEMLSFSEETKDDINLELLDDVARRQIKMLMKLIHELSRRAKITTSEG